MHCFPTCQQVLARDRHRPESTYPYGFGIVLWALLGAPDLTGGQHGLPVLFRSIRETETLSSIRVDQALRALATMENDIVVRCRHCGMDR